MNNSNKNQNEILGDFPKNIYVTFAEISKTDDFSSSETKIFSTKFDGENFSKENESSLSFFSVIDPKFGATFDTNTIGNVFAFVENRDLKIIKNGELKIFPTEVGAEIASLKLSPKGNRVATIVRKASGEYLDVIDTTTLERFKTKISNIENFNFSRGDLEILAQQSCNDNPKTNGIFVSQKMDYTAFPRKPLENYIKKECPEILFSDKLENLDEIVFVWQNSETSMNTGVGKNSKLFLITQYGQNLREISGKFSDPESPVFIKNGTEVLFFGKNESGKNAIFLYNILQNKLSQTLETDEIFDEKNNLKIYNSSEGKSFVVFQTKFKNEDFLIFVNEDGKVKKIKLSKLSESMELKFLRITESPLGLSYKNFYIDEIGPGIVVQNVLNITGRVEQSEKEQNFIFKIYDSKSNVISEKELLVESGSSMQFFEFSVDIEIPEVSENEEMEVRAEDKKGQVFAKFGIKSFSKKIQILDEEALQSLVGKEKTILNRQDVDLNNDGSKEALVLAESGEFGDTRQMAIFIIAYNFSKEEWEVKYEFKNNSLQTIVGPESQKYNFPYVVENDNGEKAMFFGVEFEKDFFKEHEKFLTYWIVDYDGKNVNVLLSESDLLRGKVDFLKSNLLSSEFIYKIKDPDGENPIMFDRSGDPTLMVEKVFIFLGGKYKEISKKEIDLDPTIRRG
ncbi:MAG: hypothetical protein Fur0024_2210 [Patescibacteria group bacterium]